MTVTEPLPDAAILRVMVYPEAMVNVILAAKSSWGSAHWVVEEVVARIPGAAFAVDDNLRVIAWNRKAEEGMRLKASEAWGRPCYEVVPAVDVETGGPCQEQCPLVRRSSQYGWAYNRVLRAPWAGGRRTRLDCFLLRCLLPTLEQANICFVSPPTASTQDAHSRVLEAIETIHPVVSGRVDPKEALAVCVRTMLRATSADAGELFLLDPETRELVLMDHQGLSTETMREFRRSTIGEGFPDLIGQSEVPLIAMGASAGMAPAGASGWYLCAPLVVESRVLGALGVASERHDFDVAGAMRVLFPMAVQLGVYLRWAYLAGEHKPKGAGERLPGEASRLRFHCLGPFRVSLDGEPVPAARFERLKALTLLKFLVANRGRPVPREALMELLWPEADPMLASGNLRVVLHALRRGLEPKHGKGPPSSFVLSEGDLIYLDPSDRVWVDTEEFARGARRAAKLASQGQEEEALGEWRRAVSLYRGEYLEDEPYSDWCLFDRERLEETYLNLLKQMASMLARRGDVAEAIETYHIALGVDEGREEIHRELMRLLWQAGRRDEGLRQYETCRRISQTALGVEPTEETKALYETLIGGSRKSS